MTSKKFPRAFSGTLAVVTLMSDAVMEPRQRSEHDGRTPRLVAALALPSWLGS